MAYGKAIIGIVTVGPTFTTGAWLLLSAGISNTHFSLESINMSGVASFHWEKNVSPYQNLIQLSEFWNVIYDKIKIIFADVSDI